MEFVDWEYLSHGTLSNSQIIEEQDQQQDDVQAKEITEITEERNVVPVIDLQASDEAKEDMEVEFVEETEENLELDISRSMEIEPACMESNESEGVTNGFNQRNQNWRLRGIGLAAATLYMLLLGGCKRRHSRDRQIQIYAGDKGMMNQVAKNPARLSHVLSAVRGSPAMMADVSFGGHYQ